MNQRIRELAEQVGYGRERWNTTTEFENFLERFAETIIRERAATQDSENFLERFGELIIQERAEIIQSQDADTSFN